MVKPAGTFGDEDQKKVVKIVREVAKIDSDLDVKVNIRMVLQVGGWNRGGGKSIS